MIDNIILRPAVGKDAAAIQELMSGEKQILAAGEVWSLKSIKNYIDANLTFVAEQDDKIVGFVIGEHLVDKGVMVWLHIVAKKLRGQGIGTMLMDCLEQAAYDQGAVWTILYCEPKAATLHKRRGATLSKEYIEAYKEL